MRRNLMLAGAALLLVVAGPSDVFAQKKKKKQDDPPQKTAPVVDTTKKTPPKPPANPSDPKPYKEVITKDAVSDDGLFTVHKVKDNYYFEIPNAILGRDILVVSRISKAAAGVRSGFSGYAGDEINELVIQFERGPDNKIFLRKVSFAERSEDSTNMKWNLTNSNLQPIAQAFDIKAFNKDSTSTVIDVTAMAKGDSEVWFFDSRSKRGLGLTAIQADKSYIVSMKSFPNNVELKTVKTYTRSAGGSSPIPIPGASAGSSEPATLELNTSMVVLPEKVMQARYFDARVGYFTTQNITDFDLNPQGIKRYQFIKRFRLEPKPADMQKYLAGELVEPANPIVYYVDPSTPKKWIPYLIQGVNDWQKAFEKAGFKNAVVAKMAPSYEEDSTWSLDDSRHNAIVYKPSDIPNASGPSIIDPRSGEIIETHINWYHNVMNLVRNWYLVQTAAVDPGARKLQFDDELMGQLIRFVSSHEVGHTLGLRHNFGSSNTVPVEKLRDKAWVEANGHTPSIMDYARFNYVAQPEDGIGRLGLFPRIGDYDLWAIEWGYRRFPAFSGPEEEKEHINKWTVQRMGANNRLWWGDGESYGDDPRCQTEDLSDNSIKASDYGLKNLKRIVPELPTYAMEPTEGYASLNDLYGNVVGQFGRYIGHVSRHVGGIPRNSKSMSQSGPVYDFTPKADQKAAVDWLQRNVFNTPTWLLPDYASNKLGIGPDQTIGSLHDRALGAVTTTRVIANLTEFEAVEGANAYTVTNLMDDLRTGIFSELAGKKPIDMHRRGLQKKFVDRLATLANPKANDNAASLGTIRISLGPDLTKSDLPSIAKGQLRMLQSQIASSVGSYSDRSSKYHLQDLQDRIKAALDPTN